MVAHADRGGVWSPPRSFASGTADSPPGCLALPLRPRVSDIARVVEVCFLNGLYFKLGFVGGLTKRNNRHAAPSSPPFSCHPERNGHHGVMSVKSNPTQGRARGEAEAGSHPTVSVETTAFRPFFTHRGEGILRLRYAPLRMTRKGWHALGDVQRLFVSFQTDRQTQI